VRYHRDHKGNKKAKLCPFCKDRWTAERVAAISKTGKAVFGEEGFTVHLEEAPQVETPASRAADPFTSHLAEQQITESGERGIQQHLVRALIEHHPGHTCRELARLTAELTHEQIHKRASECRTAGWVVEGEKRRCEVTSRLAITWNPNNGGHVGQGRTREDNVGHGPQDQLSAPDRATGGTPSGGPEAGPIGGLPRAPDPFGQVPQEPPEEPPEGW
jgi:hypothetical protein